MALRKSQLFAIALSLSLFLAVIFMLYQFGREHRLQIITTQNELQGVNERVYDFISFKYSGQYNDSCRNGLDELLANYYDAGIRLTIVSVKDGSVLYDTYGTQLLLESHLLRPEVQQAVAGGYGYDKRKSSVKPYDEYIYAAAYNKDFDFVVRSAVSYDTKFANAYPSDRYLLWFELFITAVFVVIMYYVLRHMGTSQLAKEKLLAHLRIAQEGLAIFDKRRRLILANKLFSTYGDLISATHLQNTQDIIYQPEFYNVRMFLEKSENNADGNEPCFADKIEKDGRTFSVRCVRFSDKSFEISINDTTIVEAQTQLKQQLTQNVAHEFKTPVCSIQGYLETILANYPEKLSEEQLRHFLQRCYSQSSRLNNLVKDMSQLMEINANSQYIEKERVNLSSILRNLLQEINNKLLEQQVTVKNNIPEMLLLNGNASMLYSIFRNLFDNAISYAGKGCEIKVDCYRSDSEFYYFSFSDNGEGVPREHLNRIFERFYRVDKGRSRKLGGTGLGLAIVKNAVLLHDGTISARRSDGGGLEFVFTLRR